MDRREFFDSGKTRRYEFRINALKKLREEIVKNRDEINLALNKDLGKAAFESELTEVSFTILEIDYLIKNLKTLMRDKRAKTALLCFRGRSYIKYEPYGHVLIISPWNYPFNLAVVPLAAAIAAGNTITLKTSSSSPYTSEIIEKIIKNIFEEDYIKIYKGNPGINQKVMGKKYDYIFFTGGKETGAKIYKKAAEDMVEVCLELGGKSPCIVDKTADVKISAKRIMWGKLLNVGQTCVAPDYMLCHQDIVDDMIKEMKNVVTEFYTENPLSCSWYGKIINSEKYNKLKNILDEDKIIYKCLDDKLKIEPIIVKSSWDSKLMENEIFGPILPIIVYEDLSLELLKIKNRDIPLALYLFTKDKSLENQVLSNLSYGGACVNDTIMHLTNLHLPFGGNGASGIGKYHGKYSFYCFSRTKSILNKSIFPEVNLRYAPFKNKIEKIQRFIK